MALALETPLRELPGIGETRSRALERLGLRTVGDLLHHYPRDYEDRTVRSTFRSAPEGEAVCVAAMVAEPPRLSRIRKGLELIKVKVVDAAGAATLTFFNQSYVKDALHTGETYVFYGKVEGPALRSLNGRTGRALPGASCPFTRSPPGFPTTFWPGWCCAAWRTAPLSYLSACHPDFAGPTAWRSRNFPFGMSTFRRMARPWRWPGGG